MTRTRASNRERLEALTRHGGRSALAPDGARARLSDIDSLGRSERRRAVRAAIVSAGVFLLLFVAHAIVQSARAPAPDRDASARHAATDVSPSDDYTLVATHF